MIKRTHEEYLVDMLRSKEMEISEAQIQHRIHMATHDIKIELLRQQRDSIQRQLQD